MTLPQHPRFKQFLRAGVIFLTALCLAGCGGENGPKLYPLSGEVTYKGKPVKGGLIQFEPDGKEVDPRAMTMAEIKDGRYQLPKEKGVMGGSYKVIISPTDGIPQEEETYGKSLLSSPYVTNVDLPKETATKNFDIPDEGAKK